MSKVASTVSPAIAVMAAQAALSAYRKAGHRGGASSMGVADDKQSPHGGVAAHCRPNLDLGPVPMKAISSCTRMSDVCPFERKGTGERAVIRALMMAGDSGRP